MLQYIMLCQYRHQSMIFLTKGRLLLALSATPTMPPLTIYQTFSPPLPLSVVGFWCLVSVPPRKETIVVTITSANMTVRGTIFPALVMTTAVQIHPPSFPNEVDNAVADRNKHAYLELQKIILWTQTAHYILSIQF